MTATNSTAGASGYEGRGVNRAMITASILTATLMTSLDLTIANVALPHIQGSVSASADQITWVLTSYIIAAAIMTPTASALSERYGRKNVFLVAVAGFTVTSALCGLAQNLLNDGQTDAAKAEFLAEKSAFPESAALMDRLLATMQTAKDAPK